MEKRNSKTHGREEIKSQMRRIFGGHQWSAMVGMKRERPPVTYHYQSGKTFTTESQGFDNLEIIEHWRKRGRNPIFLNAEEQRRAQEIWTAAINQFMAGNHGAVLAAAKKIAEYISDRIRQHIDWGKGQRGMMRPVKKKTRKKKEARARARGTPFKDKVLYDTGTLYEALFGEGKKLR